ncbi:DUF3618 domain-containing protein [Streptomyces triticirhizae]|uniref:DUF3618 domain-containing protein n=1 Tax=Streptomyces triticirhizae TaxID=2483353 RepID=A0A3M2LJF6_9ACTN|nr:DUF3618 domain-containing protein [Streptomyces triticirhizae]
MVHEEGAPPSLIGGSDRHPPGGADTLCLAPVKTGPTPTTDDRVDDGGIDVPEAARSAAEIEERIARRRESLAVTLDEIAVRVHPRTIVGDVKARAAGAVDRTTGKAAVAVTRTVDGVRAQLVSAEGGPRLDRVIPVAALAVAVTGLLVLSSRRRRR